jgi:hypothetical protein
MNDAKRSLLLACVAGLFALGRTSGLAVPPAELHLTDQHFLLAQTSPSNILDHVVFRDLNSNVIPHGNVASQVLDRVSNFAWRAFPPLNYSLPIAASNELASAVDFLCGTLTTTGSLGAGSAVLLSSHNSRSSSWLQVVPCQTNLVSCVTTSSVAELEYIDRLAQFLELKTGVLTNGDLIFGTAGNWPTNFVPEYTIELDVRYGQ